MSVRVDDGTASVLYAFQLLHSATARAIKLGRMKAVPCVPDGKTSTVEADGRHYKLVSVDDALPAMLEAEGELLRQEAEDHAWLLATCKRLIDERDATVGIVKETVEQNEALRELLSPMKQSIMMVKNDPQGNIASTVKFEKEV